MQIMGRHASSARTYLKGGKLYKYDKWYNITRKIVNINKVFEGYEMLIVYHYSKCIELYALTKIQAQKTNT